jgi:protein TonB
MNFGRRPQRLLVLAFVISLLIHLIFAVVVHRSRSSTPNEVEAVTIEHRSAIVRLRTPPPRPRTTPAPHPHAVVRPAPAKPQGAQPQPGGAGLNPVETAPPPQPTAAAIATTAACAKSDAPAAVTQEPPQPQVPNAARTQGTSGIVTIRVQLDARGDVTGTQVSQGTGNSSLDLVALGMARAAAYAPATHDCKPIASEYAYSVRFFAW